MIAGSAAGRASAVLTDAEVFGADLDMRNTLDGKVCVDLSFTKGSLDSVTWTAYAGPAAAPTDVLYNHGAAMTGSLSADTEGQLVFDVSGCRFFRLSLTGVGIVTNSLADFTYRYNDYQTGQTADGGLRVD